MLKTLIFIENAITMLNIFVTIVSTGPKVKNYSGFHENCTQKIEKHNPWEFQKVNSCINRPFKMATK